MAGGQIGDLAQGGAGADGDVGGELGILAPFGDAVDGQRHGGRHALGPLEPLLDLAGHQVGLARGRHVDLHLGAARVPAGVLGEVVLDAGEQHLQGDGPGHRDRDPVDHAGRRAAAQLQPAHGELPGHTARVEPSDDRLHDPGQQRGHPDQQQQDTADHQVPVEVPVLVALADHRGEHRQTGHRQQQPPPQPAPGGPRGAHHAERFDDDAAQREQRHQDRGRGTARATRRASSGEGVR